MRDFTDKIPYTEFTVADGNFDKSRKPIKEIIIHSTVGTVQSAINRFGTIGTKVSAHYIIGIDGKLWAGLEEKYTAYATGDYNTNQSSISLEHEWYQGLTPSDKLYQTSAKLVADICKFYGLSCNRGIIKGHKEIVATSCPNAIDVDRIVREAQKLLEPSKPTYEQLEQKVKDLQATEERLKKEKDLIVKQYEEKIKTIQTQSAQELAKDIKECQKTSDALLERLNRIKVYVKDT